MGTLGQYLKSAREAKDIDLRDAAQQTRISVTYLKALEEEDFAKLPGEVFVKGFLKNYVRFLKLEQDEALRRYSEIKPQPPAPSAAQSPTSPAAAVTAEKASSTASPSRREIALEPFVWGAIIVILLLAFLFSSLPMKHTGKGAQDQEKQQVPVISGMPQDPALAEKSEKLYLEVIALEDTWLLVRTDTSPQKKAVLKKGESLIWSADERFLLSYGRAGDIKLLLNGEEVAVKTASETPIRDLAVTRTGVVNQPVAAKPAQPVARKSKPDAGPAQTAPTGTNRKPAASPVPSAAPAPAPSKPSPSVSQETPHVPAATAPVTSPAQ